MTGRLSMGRPRAGDRERAVPRGSRRRAKAARRVRSVVVPGTFPADNEARPWASLHARMGSRRNNAASGAWHQLLDRASGAVLLSVVAYVPWAANTTVPWLTWLLVAGCWLSGFLLLAKWVVRPQDLDWDDSPPRRAWLARIPIILMTVLSAALLAQVAVSVWNHSAVVVRLPDGLEWTYRASRPGWPTTWDRDATLAALIRYIGLVAIFWAMRDWMQQGDAERGPGGDGGRPRLPRRLRGVAWTLAISAGAMALTGIVHRLDKAKDLLWLMPLKDTPYTQMFGSFPYRANAGQFFNMIWPLLVGAWLASQRGPSLRDLRGGTSRSGSALSFLVLCAVVMIAAVFTAASRMAIAIAIVQVVLVSLVAGFAVKDARVRFGLAGGLLAALALGWFAQGDFLRKRFENALVDSTMSNRTVIYDYARPMAARFPTWGWGAEAFRTYGELHRTSLRMNPEFVHDDRLEVVGGVGWVGAALALACLALLPVMANTSGTTRVAAPPLGLLWVGMMGLLIHACVDYPLQVPVIQVTWVILAAIAATCPWRSGRRRTTPA